MATDLAAQALLDGTFDRTAQPATRVGPNAILQTRTALDVLCGHVKRVEIFDRAGLGWLSRRDLEDLVHTRAVNALNASVLLSLAPDNAETVMAHAGELTANYIIENRIPAPVQTLLKIVPRSIGTKLLLKAIERNAWTFAGSCEVVIGDGIVSIYDNPICLGRLGYSGCVWHRAVFTRLFHCLISEKIVVEEIECIGKGGDACVFEIRFVA